jgi:hypothetical protein
MTNRPGGRDRLEYGACRKAWGSRPQSSARFGRLTGRGAGDAWKAFGTRKRVGIVRSIFRQSRVAVFDGAPSHVRYSESQPDGRPAPVRSGQAPQGVGIKTSAFRQFTCDQFNLGSAGKDRLVPSPRCKRGPFGARGSIPSTSHQLAAATPTRGFGLLAGPRNATPVMGVRFPQSAPIRGAERAASLRSES